MAGGWVPDEVGQQGQVAQTGGASRGILAHGDAPSRGARELLVTADRWYAKAGAGEGADLARGMLRTL